MKDETYSENIQLTFTDTLLKNILNPVVLLPKLRGMNVFVFNEWFCLKKSFQTDSNIIRQGELWIEICIFYRTVKHPKSV